MAEVDTREMIMSAARAAVQSRGYSSLSFRELAKEVGIKSASVHYHFPTKGDLGAALAQRYVADAEKFFEGFLAESTDPATWFSKYVRVFRAALENDNRMCLCGIMAAEYDELPAGVKVEMNGFATVNIAWMVKVLAPGATGEARRVAEGRAEAIFAAIEGAQLLARSRGDIATYDRIIQTYRATGLIP